MRMYLVPIRPAIRLAALFAVACSVWSQDPGTNPVELLHQPTAPASDRITYGDKELQFVEVRLPKQPSASIPVVVLVHGGCWSQKLEGLPEPVVSYELLRPMAQALADAGIATWSIEYRRLGSPGGGGWPETYVDLGKAADKLREAAPKYHFDLNRAIVMGHSSGGQLALWLAARPKLPAKRMLYTANPLKFHGVLVIDGPADLESVQPMERQMCGGSVVTDFMGGPPDKVLERYREGAAAAWVPLGVRQEFIIRAGADQRWKSLVEPYIRDAQKGGDQVALQTQEGRSHFDAINPQSTSWPAVLRTVKSMLGMPAEK